MADMLPTIRRMQAHKATIVSGWFTASDIEAIVEGVPSVGLCIVGHCDSGEEALTLASAIRGQIEGETCHYGVSSDTRRPSSAAT